MFDCFHRPDWDSYFMALCFTISQKSIDQHTKHGSVIVDKDHTILSVGFNGPMRNCDDTQIPLTRPDKYFWLSHSEVAAITNAAKSGTRIDGGTLYVTGYPCEVCFRSVVNAGIKKVIYGPVKSACVDTKVNDVVEKMSKLSGVELVEFKNTITCRTILENVLRKLQE